MAASVRTLHARSLFAGLGPRYDLLAELLSFGQYGRWRRFLISRVPAKPGMRVLDVATGTGLVATALARRGTEVIGLDQSEPMLRHAAARTGLGDGKIRLLLGQGERLPFPDASFDAVTFTFLLRYVDDPGATLRELARVLKPGGVLANVEFHVPDGIVPRAAWWCYTRVALPLAGRLFSRDWFEVGRFLGPSIEGFYRRYPPHAQRTLWRNAGLRDVRARIMSLGGAVVIWGVRDG